MLSLPSITDQADKVMSTIVPRSDKEVGNACSGNREFKRGNCSFEQYAALPIEEVQAVCDGHLWLLEGPDWLQAE